MNAKKKFGQNFITDLNLINKIVKEAQIEGKNVIEVGPGKGALTKVILTKAKELIAYEIDKDLSVFLNVIESENSNVKIVYEDFLKMDFKSEKQWELIGNLPYYITTPILFKFLENDVYNSATIMVQKEVGERIISAPNSKKYNALSVIVQYLTKVNKIVSVSRKMFNPVPNVDSVVIRLEKRENREISPMLEPKFFEFLKACFNQKRKTLSNNIYDNYQIDKDQIKALLSDFGFEINVRAEQLNIQEFIKLFNLFYENNS